MISDMIDKFKENSDFRDGFYYYLFTAIRNEDRFHGICNTSDMTFDLMIGEVFKEKYAEEFRDMIEHQNEKIMFDELKN